MPGMAESHSAAPCLGLLGLELAPPWVWLLSWGPGQSRAGWQGGHMGLEGPRGANLGPRQYLPSISVPFLGVGSFKPQVCV